MRKTFVWVLMAVLAMGMIACGSSGGDNGYAAATQKYNADSVVYGQAYDKLVAAQKAHRLTADQDRRASAAVNEVSLADADVYNDLQMWKSTGKEPPSFAGNSARLRGAQAVVINMALAEVQ